MNKLILKWEGYHSKPYPDSGGLPTIGCGTIKYPPIPEIPQHLYGRNVTLQDPPMSREVALKCVKYHIDYEVTPIIEKYVKKEYLNPNRYEAIESFIYNVGSDFIVSTFLKYFNKGDFDRAAKELDRWVYDNGKIIKGLVNRRADEKKVFLTPYYEESVPLKQIKKPVKMSLWERVSSYIKNIIGA